MGSLEFEKRVTAYADGHLTNVRSDNDWDVLNITAKIILMVRIEIKVIMVIQYKKKRFQQN